MKATRRRSRGLSTAEVLAGTALSLLALSALYSVQRAQTHAFAAQSTYAESQNVTRTVIDLMTRELRMATYDPLSPGALTTSPGPGCPGVEQGIAEATRTKIRFKQDLNGDGLLTGSSEDVVYDVLGSEIRRTDGTSMPVGIVTHVPVDGLAFTYYDGSNPPVQLVPSGSPPALTATQRDCVAKVRITIRSDLPNPAPDNPNTIRSQAQTEVAIRNRSLSNF